VREWLPGAPESTAQREWDCWETLRSGPLPPNEAAPEGWLPRDVACGTAESVVAAEMERCAYDGETARSGARQGEGGEDEGFWKGLGSGA
jgi:hypothetical protein